MTEAEIEAEVENGPLRGTLVMPDGPVTASVVIIPGSGPTDRDGNNPMGANAGYLRMLAEALAVEGVASIRVDKRGMFASSGSFPDANAVTFDDYAADAHAWIDVAKQETGTDCTFILGHSEGGLVALVAAQAAGSSICGIVLVAAPGRTLADVMREQLRSNPDNAPILTDALTAIDTLEVGENVDVSGFHPALQQIFAPQVQGFLIDAFTRDPAALIADTNLPVLIVQGDNDLQVTPVDAEALSRAQPVADLFLARGMNHVLKETPPDDIAANMAAYADPDAPLAAGLSDRIAEFLKRHQP